MSIKASLFKSGFFLYYSNASKISAEDPKCDSRELRRCAFSYICTFLIQGIFYLNSSYLGVTDKKEGVRLGGSPVSNVRKIYNPNPRFYFLLSVRG